MEFIEVLGKIGLVVGFLSTLLLALMTVDLFGKLRVRFIYNKADYDQPSGLSAYWWKKRSHRPGTAAGKKLFEFYWRKV